MRAIGWVFGLGLAWGDVAAAQGLQSMALAPVATPTARAGACAVWDPDAQRVWVIGDGTTLDYYAVQGDTTHTLGALLPTGAGTSTQTCAYDGVHEALWYAGPAGMCRFDLPLQAGTCLAAWSYPAAASGARVAKDGNDLLVVTASGSVFRFDVPTASTTGNPWSFLPSLPGPLGSAGVAFDQGWLHVVGSVADPADVLRLYVGDPDNAHEYAWEQHGALTAEVWEPAIAQVGQTLYVISGEHDGVETNQVIAYDLVTGESKATPVGLSVGGWASGAVAVPGSGGVRLFVLDGESFTAAGPMARIEISNAIPYDDPGRDRDCDGTQDAFDADDDGDGTDDLSDACPHDADRVLAGPCAPGVFKPSGAGPAYDTDADGVTDCLDLCPTDPTRTTEVCADACPADPEKSEPGLCGCGVPDDDTDGDVTPDCDDACPFDDEKVAPGVCGCGEPEDDTDADGTPDCADGCLFDDEKVAPGVCGCGEPEDDTDADGTPDCVDACPTDDGKTAPGLCGCGTADADADGDATIDCLDACPTDPDKTVPGLCGCGTAEGDEDDDGWPDCIDACPLDPDCAVPDEEPAGCATVPGAGSGALVLLVAALVVATRRPPPRSRAAGARGHASGVYWAANARS